MIARTVLSRGLTMGSREKSTIVKYSMYLFLFSFLFFCKMAMASQPYFFHAQKKQQQFHHLLTQLRCLVCQNENLAMSDSKISHELRRKVYLMVKAGHSDQFIKNYFIKRYGYFVLFKPPLVRETYFLWLTPFGLFLIGGFFVYGRVKKR